MTYADSALVAARSYLIARGWPANSVGIVGDPAHKSSGGYHCGNDWLRAANRLTSDYSKRESSRDRPGTDAATALDIGGVSAKALKEISLWIVDQCKADAPDTHDIREVIYYDGTAVRRFDRLGVRSSGDSSHTFHTHISYFRDSEGRDKTGLFRRYYEPAKPETLPAKGSEEEDDMKHIYSSGRWTLVAPSGATVTVTTQAKGNALAKVFGDALKLTEAEYADVMGALDALQGDTYPGLPK